MHFPFRSIPWFACAGMLCGIAGCAGYQVGALSLYRPDIRTVRVEVFQSDSFRRNLGERLTEAIVKELERNSPYKVVQSSSADSVLTGRIVDERKQLIAENVNDEPREIGTDMVVQVRWHDRRGGVILQDTSFVLSPLSFVVAEGAKFVPEGGQSVSTAHQETISRLARQIVAQMEAPW
ncbi:MAG: LPS assembly lipoprotein LptE [Pirellulaceae bacterium]